MGKSKSIQDQQKQNQEFQDYLKQIQEELKNKAQENFEKFESEKKDYYGDDFKNIISVGTDEKYDFRQVNEVTLDNLKDVIHNTVNAIFPGTEQSGDMKQDAKEAVASIVNYKDMAMKVALNLVSAALDAFKVTTEISYSCNYRAESICPGLTLHILVATDSYKDHRWFSNSEIVENYIRYELIFSYKKAGAEMDIDYFNNQLKSIHEFEVAVNEMNGKYLEMFKDISVDMDTLKSVKQRIDFLKEQVQAAREEVQATIDKHTTNKLQMLCRNADIQPERHLYIREMLQGGDEADNE